MKRKITPHNNLRKKPLVIKSNNYYLDIVKLYYKSMIKFNWNDLTSVVTDFSMIFFTMIVHLVFNLMYGSAMNNINSLVVGDSFIDPSFFSQFKIGFQLIGSLLFSYLLFMVFYSLVNSIFWIKFSNKKTSLKLILGFVKNNLIFSSIFIFLIYLIRAIVVEPVWAFIDLFLIFLFFIVMPVMHTFYVEKIEVKTIKLMSKSFKFLYSNFVKLLLPIFSIIFTIITVLVVNSKLFGSDHIIGLILSSTIFLFFVSWVRKYIYNLVMYFEKNN